MKYILFFIFFYCCQVSAQSNIYDFRVQTKNGKSINLQDFKGKKILIASVGAKNLQEKSAFSYWDSIQTANPKIAIIIIPSDDFSEADSISASVDGIKVPPSSKTTVSASVSVKKDKGDRQNPLMQWLTHAGQNTHFDADVTTEKQLYIISESGVLYAVLEKGVPPVVISQLLKQEDVKN
jgi:glutathione peroxidase